MKYIISIFLVSGLWAIGTLSAQQPAGVDSSSTALDSKIEIYQKENIPFKKPIPYVSVREADVMREWVVWREIDLRQRANFPLYYPTEPKSIGGRKNFFLLLMEGIERGEITPYNPFPTSDEFAQVITMEDITNNPSIKFEDRMVPQVSVITGNDTLILIKGKNLLEEDIPQRIRVKEKIYFNKKYSWIEHRIIGICPVFVNIRDGSLQPSYVPVCWIYMDEARPLLARHPVFNPFNSAQNISYDDFFMQRRYSGEIYKKENVFNNRKIDEYLSGLDVLYEARRIENEIFDFEQDMWEY